MSDKAIAALRQRGWSRAGAKNKVAKASADEIAELESLLDESLDQADAGDPPVLFTGDDEDGDETE